MNRVEKLKKIIEESKSIVFFGGAGVSVASNIPDFRSTNGLYQEKGKFLPEDILSHSFFMKYPEEFYHYYFSKMIYQNALPNNCHRILKNWEDSGKLKAVITQNIDGLHQKAGSKKVLELHGSVHRNYCLKCHKFYDLTYMINNQKIPKCFCGGLIKPDVVLYEESLDYKTLEESLKFIENCDTLIVGGTSLLVNPAAGLVSYFQGNNLVIINKSETPYDQYASLIINDDIDQVFLEVEKMLTKKS